MRCNNQYNVNNNSICNICDNDLNQCSECNKKYKLDSYLTPNNTYIDTLYFFISSHVNNNDLDLFILPILPPYITIKLKRCGISFDRKTDVTDSDNITIVFNYNLSNHHCLLQKNKETNYSVNITSSSINIHKQFIVTDISNDVRRESSMLCDYNNDDINHECVYFDGNSF